MRRRKKNGTISISDLEKRRKYERERKRRQREKIKQCPEKLRLLKEKNREYKKRERSKKKYQSIKEKPKREQEKQRAKWRKYKASRKVQNSSERAKDSKKISGRKRLRKNRESERRILLKKDARIKKLEKSVKTLRKCVQRLKNKTGNNNKSSVVREVEDVMNEGSEAIKKRLTLGIALEKQLIINSKDCRSEREKQILTNLVSGQIIRKNKLIAKLSKTGITSNYMQRQRARRKFIGRKKKKTL